MNTVPSERSVRVVNETLYFIRKYFADVPYISTYNAE